MIFNRTWAMPNADTFSIPPIRDFVQRYAANAKIIIDPFARNCMYGTHRNDLNPDTKAEYHMDSADFCKMLSGQKIKADLILFDPPYSPRQISECYSGIGKTATMQDTQTAALYKRTRDELHPLIAADGVILSFGWSTNGMGVKRGFDIEEILLVAHGGAHNDTICMAERRLPSLMDYC